MCASAWWASDDPVNGGAVLNPPCRHGRPAAAVIAAAVLALLVAACSGSSSSGPGVANIGSSTGSGGSSGAGGSTSPGQRSVLAFSRCMRSHGVPNFPDPVDEVDLPKISPEILGVSSSQFNAAESACQNLLPPTGEISGNSRGISDSVERCIVGGVCSPAVTHWLQHKELKYAQCMRSHGIPSWPDPTTDAQGRLTFAVPVAWAAHPPEPQSGICERQSGAPIR
jgi:hypothetical protein